MESEDWLLQQDKIAELQASSGHQHGDCSMSHVSACSVTTATTDTAP